MRRCTGALQPVAPLRGEQALALFVLPILQARLGTDMFQVVAISAATPIVFLLIVRDEPTARDIDDEGVA